MSADVEAAPPAERTGPGTLARRGGIALVLAVVVNAVVTTVALAAGVGAELQAMSYGSVLALTTLGVVGATLTYGVLTWMLDDPDRGFVAVAAVVLALSLVPDFTYIPSEPGGSLVAGAILGSMHVITAAISVAVLTGRLDLA